jgi:endonuclease/exonuclease/phosphatase family metal-dependent hydrolase
VRAWRADVLFLQEVCGTQFAAIRAALPGYSGAFKSQLHSGRCNGSGKHGIAILVRGAATNIRWWNIGGIEALTGSTYFMLAVNGRTADGRAYTAATAHLRVKCDAGYDSTDCAEITREARADQTEAMVDELNPLVRAGVPVVLGGDLNMVPTSPPMSRFYGPSAGGVGLFVEADGGAGRTGESTACEKDVKIDYVFYSRSQFGSVDGDAAECSIDDRVSDHKLLRATATWR